MKPLYTNKEHAYRLLEFIDSTPRPVDEISKLAGLGREMGRFAMRYLRANGLVYITIVKSVKIMPSGIRWYPRQECYSRKESLQVVVNKGKKTIDRKSP